VGAAAEYKGKSGAGLYGDYVNEVDAMIGRVLDTVHALGHGQNPGIVTSDNGAWWNDQDIATYPHRAKLAGAVRRPTSGRPDTASILSRAGRDTFLRTRCAMRRHPSRI